MSNIKMSGMRPQARTVFSGWIMIAVVDDEESVRKAVVRARRQRAIPHPPSPPARSFYHGPRNLQLAALGVRLHIRHTVTRIIP
jgi:hypothetical protein